MQVSEHLGMLEVLLVVLQEHFTRILIQCALGEWYNQKTLDHFKDVIEGPCRRIPVFFEGVHTDLAFFGDVGMENLGDEVA